MIFFVKLAKLFQPPIYFFRLLIGKLLKQGKYVSINIDKLVYLDLEFISRKYEEVTGINPTTSITTQEGGNADIKAYFATAGINTSESRTYSITSRQMLEHLSEHLTRKYPKFKTFENSTGTKIVWISGYLSPGSWQRDREEPDEKSDEHYELFHDEQRTVFLTEPSYFAAGFAKILRRTTSPMLKRNIDIPVKCLTRVMWHVEVAKNLVACPYIIVEDT